MANDLSAFNAETWSDRMVMKLDQTNVMLPLVNRNWEGDLRNSKTVKVRTAGNISMGAYTKGTAISYQDLAPSVESFTVSDSQYFAFFVDDVDKAQTDLSAMDIYQARAVTAMNNLVESKLLATYTSAATANKITGASSAAITLDSSTSTSTGIYQIIVKARANLSKANVPNTPGSRWMVVDPDTTSLFLNDTAHFVRASEMGDTVVQTGIVGGEEVQRTAAETPGFVGRILNFDIYETPNVPTSGGAKFLPYGDKEAISYAAQIVEMEALRLQDFFGNAIRGLMLHGTFVAAENALRLGYIKATP